jgi:hypothetical protein
MAVLEDLRQPLRTPVDSHDIAESLEASLSKILVVRVRRHQNSGKVGPGSGL